MHEIKFDGRMTALNDRGAVRLLTRSGLDWTAKYPATAAALANLPVEPAYIDGELCGVREDGVTSFELIQQASDTGYGGLVYFAFDLLELDGDDVARLPLLERKERPLLAHVARRRRNVRKHQWRPAARLHRHRARRQFDCSHRVAVQGSPSLALLSAEFVRANGVTAERLGEFALQGVGARQPIYGVIE